MSSTQPLSVSVIKIAPKGVTSYVGKMRALDILELSDLKRWTEERFDGYQRQLYKERMKEIAGYLKECVIPVIPAILVSIREDVKFTPINSNDVGTLEIPRAKGAIVLIDGQHRMSGFEYYVNELQKIQEEKRYGIQGGEQHADIDEFTKILDYDVPVFFVDSKAAAEIVEKQRDPLTLRKEVIHEDVERMLFYIINKTQKAIRPSLKDTLQFQIYRAGIRGIPPIEEEKWRIDATDIAHRMNRNGPLATKLNPSGERGMQRPIQLSSFVTSLQRLFSLEDFAKSQEEGGLSLDQEYGYIKAYWIALQGMFPEAFANPGDYLVMKTIGVYSLNWLASNVYEWCRKENLELNEKNLSKFLEPLKGFDWGRRTSRLRAFGGVAGVNEAYKILLQTMADGGVAKAKETMEEIRSKEEAKQARLETTAISRG
jgi:hypothetical protein